MRSRNVSPGLAVMRTTSQSDSTRVPPVTAEKSPPLRGSPARFAGDRALVDRGDAFDHLAVARDRCRRLRPARRRPCAELGGRLGQPSWRRRCGCRRASSAMVSLRAPRSAAACALPRPSAIASAKLANSTVNQSQSATRQDEAGRRLARAAQRLDPQQRGEDAADVDDEHHRVAPLRARIELARSASTQRRARRSAASNSGQRVLRTSCMVVSSGAVLCRREHLQVLDDRAERERRARS